jgi:hypothetical protein
LEQLSLKSKCAKDSALLLQLPAKTQNTKTVTMNHPKDFSPSIRITDSHTHGGTTSMLVFNQKTYPAPTHIEKTPKVSKTLTFVKIPCIKIFFNNTLI